MTGSSAELAGDGTLPAALKDVRDELRRLNADGRRNRHLIRWLAVSLALDVILTVVVAVFAVQAHDATAAAQGARQYAAAVHSSQVAACRIGNQLRSKEVQLWDHLAAISSPPPHLSKAQLAVQRQKVAALLAYVRRTFPVLNCQALYRLGAGKP